MANVNLGREQGVRVTGAAGHGGTNVNYAPAIGAVGQVGNAFENASRGIKHVSDSLFGIYNDLADSRNRQEFLEGQTAAFDITNAENEKLEERIRNGEFDRAGGVEAFKAAAMQSQEKIKKAFADWSGKNITQIDTRKALNEHLTLDSKRNFAHMSGRFIAHDNERRFGLMKSQCERAVEDGSMENQDGSMKNLDAAIRAYCGGGKDKDGNERPRYKSQEFEDALRREYARKLKLRIIERELSSISDIENDAEKMGKIKEQVKIYQEALNGKISDESLSFLTQSDLIKAKNAYSKLYGAAEADFKKKRDANFAYRLARFWEADDASLAEREKKLYKFVNENPAFNAEEKAEARIKIRQTVAAALDKRQKLADLQIKEAIKAQNEHTDAFISGKLKGENIEYSQDEENNIAQVRAAAKSAFSLPDKDQNGKIIKTAAEKQEAYKWKLEDAVKNYDPKTDEDGSFARALYYQIEGVFDDSVSREFVRAPSKEEREWEVMDEPARKKFILNKFLAKQNYIPQKNHYVSDTFPGVSISGSDRLRGILKNYDYAAERDRYLSEIGGKLNREEYSPLIHDAETKNRLLRELGQRRGVYPDAKISKENVNALLRPMADSVLGKPARELKDYQKTYLEEVEMGFVHAAMTAGLDSPDELGNWFRTSPYVATFKERLRLLKETGRDESFDTSFSHIGRAISGAPVLAPQGANRFEELYLKLQQNKNSQK